MPTASAFLALALTAVLAAAGKVLHRGPLSQAELRGRVAELS